MLCLSQVTSHHEELLVQAAGVTELEGSLTAVRSGLSELDTSLDKYETGHFHPDVVYEVFA